MSVALSPDTQALLLLCSPFTQHGHPDAKPLTLTEYNVLAASLSQHKRRPADLLESVDADLPDLERIRALLDRGFQMAAAVEQWQRLGLWVLGRDDEDYPERLRATLGAAAPVLLYGAGDVGRLAQGGLAIVGSRDIDEEGLSFTRRVAERCALAEMQVVSGGARGVDQAAVAAALEAGGGAVTVLADRLDRTATSRDAKELLRRGVLTLVTSYEPESGFTAGKAMGRNKHIYGLADYALVVRFMTGAGGTWAGAVEQLNRNKSSSAPVPVFVRTEHNPPDGCRTLHKKGAFGLPEEDFWHGKVRHVLQQFGPAQPDLFPAPLEDKNREGEAPAELVLPAQQEPRPPEAKKDAPPPVVPSPPDKSASADDYADRLAALREHLRDEPGPKQLGEIARRMSMSLKDLRACLGRAIAEGTVLKKKKKTRIVYLDPARASESPLFGP